MEEIFSYFAAVIKRVRRVARDLARIPIFSFREENFPPPAAIRGFKTAEKARCLSVKRGRKAC